MFPSKVAPEEKLNLRAAGSVRRKVFVLLFVYWAVLLGLGTDISLGLGWGYIQHLAVRKKFH